MKAKISMVKSDATPASVVLSTNKTLVNDIADIMVTVMGVSAIASGSESCGIMSRTVAEECVFFEGVPDEIRAQGEALRDTVAEILAVANVKRIEVELPNDELTGMMDAWASFVSKAKQNPGQEEAPQDGSCAGCGKPVKKVAKVKKAKKAKA